MRRRRAANWGIGEVWSSRQLVTLKVTGSNPVYPAEPQRLGDAPHLKWGIGGSKPIRSYKRAGKGKLEMRRKSGQLG